jgi:undecaprenyl diphosphate synthase
MDGNGRWAKSRGLPRLKGHEAGAETVRRVLRYCRDYGVSYLTLYAFSTENWSRPAAEVAGLMRLLEKFLEDNLHELHEHDIRLRVIGRREDLPKEVRKSLANAEAETAGHQAGQLIVALSYGGRAELADAARALARDVAAGKVDPETVEESSLASRLYAPDVPDPDLILRTSGEMRLSNFLLWQAAYAELLVTPVLWPDFGEDDFRAALDAFARRDRRYGGLTRTASSESTADREGGSP